MKSECERESLLVTAYLLHTLSHASMVSAVSLEDKGSAWAPARTHFPDREIQYTSVPSGDYVQAS